MSIVTLRSTEDFGGASANVGAAVNFQNHFKDPIDVKRDDTIQITSVTINQDITGFKIGAGNNEFQFRIGDASPNGETPFFQLHRVRIPEGTYDGVALATLMAKQLNNSLTLFGYTFTVAFVAATKNFSIDMTQSIPSALINTAVQVEGARILQPATFLPQYPLCPVNPGITNLFTAFFSAENNNPNFTPSAAEQTILLGVASNHIKAALSTSSNPIKGKAYQYVFNRPIDERLGEHNVSVNPSFALGSVDLLQLDYTGGGPPTTIQKHVQIDNILGAGVNRIYTVTATGAANMGNTLPYYYKLEDTTKYIGLPEAVALVSPNAITGINSSANNVLSSGGDSYNVGDVMQCSNAVPDKPIAEVLAVSPAGGAVTAYRILYPGSGFTAGQALTFPNNRPGANPMIVTMGVGGFRTSAAGINSAATPPPAANIVVGQTYKCSFPSGSTENPLAGNTFPITRVQLDNDANEIDLNVKIESIDATTRVITGVSFVSCGLKAHSPNFTRLLKTISDGQSRVMVQDGNGNLHTPQASWISISQLRADGDDAPLYFGNTMDGLCYLTDVAGNQPLTPAGAQVTINGVSTSCVFSMMANDGVKTRAYIKNVGRLSQVNVDTTSALYGNYLDSTVGLKIHRYDNATGNLLDLRNQTKKTKVDYEVNLTRGQAIDELITAEQLGDGDDFFCRVTNQLYHLRTDDANRGGIFPILTTTMEVGVRNYGPGDTLDTTGPSTEVIVYSKFMNATQIPNYDMSKIDKIGWGINNLNQLSWTLDQDSPAAGWVPITHTFFQAGAVDADANPIRESIFPLMPVMKFSQGLSIEEQISNTTPPVASQFIPGQSYTNIQGKYHTRQAKVFNQLPPADNYSQSAALNTFIQPPGILASLLEEPSTDPTIANQTGGGLTTLVQTPLLYKFGDVLPSQTTAADNPVPGVGGATSVSIGAIDRDPNTANLAVTMGMDEVVNLNNFEDTQTLQATSSAPGELIAGAPTVFLEFPDFNIQGYSGAAKDKFPIVATMPTEEWNTGLDKGTLHYKPLFPLPVEVNLPEDKKLYSMTARIRNLDGTLANNLKNPTTITFYKKPRESRTLEEALNRANQRRSEKQDQNISMRINDFPIGTQ